MKFVCKVTSLLSIYAHYAAISVWPNLSLKKAIMAVYNVTESNLKNRLKFLSWSIPKMADFAWKVIK